MNYQCYYRHSDGTRCEKEQKQLWCSTNHRIAWQTKTYKNARPTIEEMRKRLIDMKKQAHINQSIEANGQRKMF